MSDDANDLKGFDGFTRQAATDGMFNGEQLGHMRYLSSLPADRKCGCGWYEKGGCYNCNLKELENRGGRVTSTWRGTTYFLPSGEAADYCGVCDFLRQPAAQSAAGAAGH